jgi:hypothetical protein
MWSSPRRAGAARLRIYRPVQKQGFDAAVALWVRAGEVAVGLDEVLYGTVRRWLADRWPFTRVAWPGRELPWDQYDALPDRVIDKRGAVLAEPAR